MQRLLRLSHPPRTPFRSWRCCQRRLLAESRCPKTVVAGYAEASYYGSVDLPAEDLSPRRPFIIGVAGGTACGKTSVCQEIIRQLQNDSMPHRGILSISQDCFYRNLEPGVEASTFNFDHPDAFDFDQIKHTLWSLREGCAVNIPIDDFVTSSRIEAHTHVETSDVILFDGILAFYNKEIRDLFDIKIFVDTDADTRLARRIRRDIVERGRDVLQVLEQYERTVKPSFDSYIQPTKRHADVIIPRGADNVVAIDLLLQHVRHKIQERNVQQPAGLFASA